MNALPIQPETSQLATAFQAWLANGQSSTLPTRLLRQNQVGAMREDHQEYHRRYWAAVAEVDQLLTQAEIKHLFIKTVRAYPSDDSNIDIVCQTEEDFQRACALARQQGRRPTKSYHEPDKVMFRLYRGRNELKPAWHLHRGVTWNGVPYLETERVFAERRQAIERGVSIDVPSSKHGLLINAGHALFENFIIPFGEAYDTIVVSREIDDWDSVFSEARQNGWEGGLRDYLGLVKFLTVRLELPHGFPDAVLPRVTTIRFPIPIPFALEATAFFGRISHNVRTGRTRFAFRELYAYPLFYLIERIKMLFGYA